MADSKKSPTGPFKKSRLSRTKATFRFQSRTEKSDTGRPGIGQEYESHLRDVSTNEKTLVELFYFFSCFQKVYVR